MGKDLNNLSLLNFIIKYNTRRMRKDVHVEPLQEGRGVYRILAGRSEGKR
jgi:hypothetical protein